MPVNLVRAAAQRVVEVWAWGTPRDRMREPIEHLRAALAVEREPMEITDEMVQRFVAQVVEDRWSVDAGPEYVRRALRAALSDARGG